jgi:uncharacterized protein YodC (DUF2158 family)
MDIGDVVKLKSGGPTMTVEVITKETAGATVRCVWFDDAEFKRGIFPAATLEKAEDDEMEDRSLGLVGLRSKKLPSR